MRETLLREALLLETLLREALLREALLLETLLREALLRETLLLETLLLETLLRETGHRARRPEGILDPLGRFSRLMKAHALGVLAAWWPLLAATIAANTSEAMTTIGHALLAAGAATAVVVYLVALLLLGLLGLHRSWLTSVVLRADRRGLPDLAPGAGGDAVGPAVWPTVTVQCPLFNEPDVGVRLVEAACALDYPRDRLHVQVLDDSTDETSDLVLARAEQLRRDGVNVEVLRRADRVGYKAGALDAGLRRATGELVAIFDADFVPPPDFLLRTVPQFADPRVGLVQARWGHLNRERSLLTRVQALLLDGHFLVEHAGRSRAERFFNFNGTAGVFRRRCIEDAGGWEHDTLTEDLDLSYRAQLAGWRFVFLEDVVAPAELPVDVNAWKSQQRRWTRGSVQTARKLLPRILAAPLPRAVKLEAVLHLTGNAAYPLLLALALTTFPAAMARHAWGWGPLAWLELPLLLATTGAVAAFYAVGARRRERNAITSLGLLPPLMALGVGSSLNSTRAVLAGLGRTVGEFVRTPKSGDATGDRAALVARHRFGPDGWACIETAFGLALAAETLAAARLGLWHALPFLTLFAVGFLAVGLGSLRRGRPSRLAPTPAA